MNVKFSQLPHNVQSDVMAEVRFQIRQEAISRIRYYKNNGFSLPDEYKKHLAKTLKPSVEQVKETLIEYMVNEYVSNGYKLSDWMAAIPNAKAICSTAFTPKHC